MPGAGPKRKASNMSNSIRNALANVDRMRANARAAIASMPAELFTGQPAGTGQPLASVADFYGHNRGWVFACVNAIAKRIAGQPVHVGRELKTGASRKVPGTLPGRMKAMAGRIEELPTHPVLDLLHDPSALHTAWTLVYSFVASLELTGRSFLWKAGDELHALPTSWVRGFEGGSRYEAWQVQPPGIAKPFTIPADQMVYAFLPDPRDPHASLSPLQAAALAVTADEAVQRSQLAMFSNGIMPKYALLAGRLPGVGSNQGARPALTYDQRQQLITTIRKAYSGVSNAGEPLILDALIEDVKKLSNSPAEMDFLNSSKDLKARILQIFGVNPIVLGEIEGANRASAVVAEQSFLNGTVGPLCELLSQALTEWLGPMFGHDLVVWIEPPIARDGELVVKEAALLAKYSAVTTDELRGMFGLPPMADGSGNQPPGASRGFDFLGRSFNGAH